MPELKWGPSLELGVDEMDQQHRRLIDGMQEIQRLSEADGPSDLIERALVRLLALTERHFDDEERYMHSIGYEGVERHAQIHREMLERLRDYIGQFQSGNGRLPPGLMRFLVYWLSAHIQGIDAKYAAVVQPLQP